MLSKITSLKTKIRCKDHTVSGEEFDLLHDPEFDMLITHPQPSAKKLLSYYESENYISHTDRKQGLFEKLYQLIKNLSLQKKLKLLTKLNSGPGKVLDIGAGTGDFLVTAFKSNWNVYGTEPNEKARILANQKGVHLVPELFDITETNFDAITLWHVLEHVQNLKEYIHCLSQLMSKHSTLIIAVPNFKSYDAEYYKQYWAAYDVPRHLWHFSQSSIKQLANEQNLIIEKTLPMKFDSYYVSLLSEKYKNGKINWINAFRTGFISNMKAKQNNEYSSLIYVLKKPKND